MNIWVDFTNIPHAHFLSVILRHLGDKHGFFCTAREFAELEDILCQKNIEFKKIGRYYRNKFLKIVGMVKREAGLFKNCGNFDLAISCGGSESVCLSKIRLKKSIVFDDNDISPNWLYARFADYFICPRAFDTKKIVAQGLARDRVYLYDGYKEDLYIADYTPEPSFLSKIPFEEYVVVRPENLAAAYIKRKYKNTIVPELLRKLSESKKNVIFLPRYDNEEKYAQGLMNVFIPPYSLNGLDLCFYSEAVFTGAGTLAREAACMGIPAISFFPGDELLSVDKKMVGEGRLFHCRNADKIIDYFNKSGKRKFDIGRCKRVQKQVLGILDTVLEEVRRDCA